MSTTKTNRAEWEKGFRHFNDAGYSLPKNASDSFRAGWDHARELHEAGEAHADDVEWAAELYFDRF